MLYPLTLALALAAWLGNAPAGSSAVPTDQLLVYYNARMALREGRAKEALELWLLRNAIESKSGRVSAHDDDFRSVTWAATGQLGLCQDGFPKDEAGAGLWPIAFHNWVVENMFRPPIGPGPSPFVAFELGRQKRFVSLHDVLDAAELRAVQFHRSSCLGPTELLFGMGEGRDARLIDRRVAARVLRHLLREALSTLVPEHTTGRAAIEARIFDLNLQLAALTARAERRSTSRAAREARRRGLSGVEIADSRDAGPNKAIPADSEEGRILRKSLSWTAEDWMSLSSDRRQFLFAHAARTATDAAANHRLIFAIIDRLIEMRQGAELESWIAHASAANDPALRRSVWSGERGRRILSLDRETGFRERAVIALHRGVDLLSTGDLTEALRSLAHALRWTETSRAAEEVRSLSRRWLSFVTSQFRITDELFAMLRSVVPRGDYAIVLEDQLWHAALNADERSFQRCVRHQMGRGALSRRVEILRPLANGDTGAFSTTIRDRLAESPYFALRFIRQFLERLQAQDADVRVGYVPTLRQLQDFLEDEVERNAGAKRSPRGLEASIGQIRAIIEGLTGIVPPSSDGDRARALSPDREIFAGNLRIAPTDPLPWPFAVADVKAPPVFTRLSLRPEEWRHESGALVFGWRIGD